MCACVSDTADHYVFHLIVFRCVCVYVAFSYSTVRLVYVCVCVYVELSVRFVFEVAALELLSQCFYLSQQM